MSKTHLTLVPEEVYNLSRGPETTAQRIKRLQLEARVLAREQIEALITALNDVSAMADEIAAGGEAYPVGARELASRLAEDLPMKAQTLKVLLPKG